MGKFRQEVSEKRVRTSVCFTLKAKLRESVPRKARVYAEILRFRDCQWEQVAVTHVKKSRTPNWGRLMIPCRFLMSDPAHPEERSPISFNVFYNEPNFRKYSHYVGTVHLLLRDLLQPVKLMRDVHEIIDEENMMDRPMDYINSGLLSFHEATCILHQAGSKEAEAGLMQQQDNGGDDVLDGLRDGSEMNSADEDDSEPDMYDRVPLKTPKLPPGTRSAEIRMRSLPQGTDGGVPMRSPQAPFDTYQQQTTVFRTPKLPPDTKSNEIRTRSLQRGTDTYEKTGTLEYKQATDDLDYDHGDDAYGYQVEQRNSLSITSPLSTHNPSTSVSEMRSSFVGRPQNVIRNIGAPADEELCS